ncbi:hypothetical protein HanPSC8_Chr07g0302261 [Helianthus annuus]|nr:hypothetical protein HanPSC8_Chr07g0302261 [Helianthus annuus]
MHFLLTGLKDSLRTSIEIFTLLEKVMQVIMFGNCLNLFTEETKE